MAAQDEGRVPLDKLPLADLKTWIEDWLQLNAAAALIQPVGGGGSSVTIVQGETEHNILGGVQIPKWRGWTSFDRAFTVGEVIFVRFSVYEDTTVSTMAWTTQTAINAADKFDMGIYDSTLTSLLRSSGAITPVGVGGHMPMPLSSALDLAANTQYVAALVQTVAAGSANNYVAASLTTTWDQILGSTFATVLTGAADNGGAPYAALPANLTTAASGLSINAACGPLTILT